MLAVRSPPADIWPVRLQTLVLTVYYLSLESCRPRVARSSALITLVLVPSGWPLPQDRSCYLPGED